MEQQAVIIFGATGMGKIALEIFNSKGITAFCFLDDDEKLHGQEINQVSIMGNTDDDGFLKFIGKKAQAFVAVEDPIQRESLSKMIMDKRKVMPMNAIHEMAYVAESVHLGYGNLINVGVIISPDVKIPNHCVVNSQAVLEYEVELGDFVQVGAGAIIGAKAQIGEGTIIGAGAIIASGIKIGKKAQIAPGAVVLQEVKAKGIAFGNPATIK
ncbi:MAG: sugar O-acyltransferase (sialic acid O-acetyltransferase NeuD family) [Arenicella sp.]|jgi:sugar O-acyltransferase (sialic acid O-acetyltransferase NeuD family)